MLCLRPQVRFGLAVAAALSFIVLRRPTMLAAACVGDCNADGMVTVDELLQGVNSALGNTPVTACTAVDVNDDGEVTINELLAAVNATLNGCPLNHAPDVPCFGIYEAYQGSTIGLPIDAADMDGDSLHYTAGNLPDGAQLDAQTGIFSWTPTAQQVGTVYVPFTVTDNGTPPLSSDGLLTLRVAPEDRCLEVTCAPASGCDSTPIALSEPCCTDQLPRVSEPVAACPDGRALFVGRNTTAGFGRLQDSDRLQLVNTFQTSATVRLNIQARCVNTSAPATLHVRLETPTRLVFDSGVPIFLDPADNGYLQRVGVPFQVQAAGPFFDFDGTDADLTVTLTDVDGVAITTRVRPTLTFSRLADLTDLDAGPPATSVTCP
jgi:hypothetical protein